MSEYNTRQDIIDELIANWGCKQANFDRNKTAKRFWTYNRLIHYLYNLKRLHEPILVDNKVVGRKLK